MVKPKKKRKGDAVEVAYSVMRDVIALSEKPMVKGRLKRQAKPKK